MEEKRHSRELTKDILYKEKIETGLTTKEIAKKYNCSGSTVTRRCHRYGIDVCIRDISKEITKEEFHEMYIVKQMSLKDILAKYNTTHTATLSNLAKSWGYVITNARTTLNKQISANSKRIHPHICGAVLTCIVARAKKACSRNISVEITLDDIWNKLLEQNRKCALSGVEVSFPRTTADRNSRLYNASVDRVDSSKGYTVDNIQIVHKDLNTMKFDYSQEDFIRWCIIVGDFQKEKCL